MGDRKAHSRRGQLLWATAAGLVVSVIGIGYSALYTPEMGRRAADAIDSAEAAGTAAAAASPASDISVSVSVPPDIAFTGGVESARTAETIATAIQDRRRDPVVSMSASPPTRSVVIASVSAVEESSAPIPVTVPPASALADAQGRDPEVDRVTAAPAGAPRAPGIRARAHSAVPPTLQAMQLAAAPMRSAAPPTRSVAGWENHSCRSCDRNLPPAPTCPL